MISSFSMITGIFILVNLQLPGSRGKRRSESCQLGQRQFMIHRKWLIPEHCRARMPLPTPSWAGVSRRAGLAPPDTADRSRRETPTRHGTFAPYNHALNQLAPFVNRPCSSGWEADHAGRQISAAEGGLAEGGDLSRKKPATHFGASVS